jgi:hypothetical protein
MKVVVRVVYVKGQTQLIQLSGHVRTKRIAGEEKEQQGILTGDKGQANKNHVITAAYATQCVSWVQPVTVPAVKFNFEYLNI